MVVAVALLLRYYCLPMHVIVDAPQAAVVTFCTLYPVTHTKRLRLHVHASRVHTCATTGSKAACCTQAVGSAGAREVQA
jgi:hypothetical protein